MSGNGIQRQRDAFAYRFASWFHPEIGIEEYPDMKERERKALYKEIVSQGGPEILSNVYHPENWGSGSPNGLHHYIARGHDGTIHGVLTAFRDYRTMEPKRKLNYPQIWVQDVYTGDDAPKGTGTALMQAAAHRAMRDGADFSVKGVVPHASGFYHTLGGTRQPNYDRFEWTPEDRDALAMGTPNPKPVTPMSGTLVGRPDPPFGNDLVDPVMPPGADDPVEMWQKFVPHQLRKRQQRQANSRIAMPTWYHLTDDPEFQLDPDRIPTNLNVVGPYDVPGVFLTQRPEEWAESSSDDWTGNRPYVAEIDAPDDLHKLPGAWHDPLAARPTDPFPGAEETFVPADQYHQLKVKRVRPRNEHISNRGVHE